MSDTIDKINGLAAELVKEAREADAPGAPIWGGCTDATPAEFVAKYAGVDTPGSDAYMKKDAGKPTQPELLDAEWLIGVGRVLKFGAEKYAPNRWREGMAWSRVYGALLRHLFAFWSGEETDEETGLPHLHHAACCLMFLSSYSGARHGEYHQHDDRPLS